MRHPCRPCKFNPIHVELPKSARDLSEELARELRVWLGSSGAELIALSSSARSTKVRQMAGGAVYLADGSWESIHDEKLDARWRISLASCKASRSSVFYWFKHELERLRKRFPQAELISEAQHRSMEQRRDRDHARPSS
jgi:hypothetical protein